MKTALALLVLAALAAAANARGDVIPPSLTGSRADTSHVEVLGARVHLKELVRSATDDLDLGASPPIGSTRIIQRLEIERACTSANVAVPKKVPNAIRVTRKMRHLSATEIADAVRTQAASMTLPKSATISNVRAMPLDVPADFQRVSFDLPKLPRRAGMITVPTSITFHGADDVAIMRGVVKLDLILPPEAAFADIARGASVTLVIKRGLVEVSAAAVATTDADIGSVIPVTLKPSGRVLRARALDKEHVVFVEEGS